MTFTVPALMACTNDQTDLRVARGATDVGRVHNTLLASFRSRRKDSHKFFSVCSKFF